MNGLKQIVYHCLERFLDARGLEIQRNRLTNRELRGYLTGGCREFVMVSTVPKSGTHRVALFFYVLDQLLSGRDLPNISEYQAGHIERLPSMGVSLKIGHSSNPFMEVDLREEMPYSWSEIPWYVNGWNSARWILDAMVEAGADKIVHIYRNPLDQSVSWFHMKKAQIRDGMDFFTDDCGRKIPLEASLFLRHLTLPLWVRVHSSFAFHREQSNSRVLMISYEDLMRETEVGFGRILDFYDIDLGPKGTELVEKAVKLTSRDRVRALEDSQKESLLNIGGLNQEVKNEWRHARDGSSGQWKAIFSEEDVLFARKYLEQHGLNLDDYL